MDESFVAVKKRMWQSWGLARCGMGRVALENCASPRYEGGEESETVLYGDGHRWLNLASARERKNTSLAVTPTV